MKAIEFTQAASSDLDDILKYIAIQRPRAAVQIIKRIRDKCELLIDHPEIGQVYPEFGSLVRGIPEQRWMIFYRVEKDSIQILRIIDGARDINLLFS